MKKNCPRCLKPMETLKLKGSHFPEIPVERCPYGCGLWFDKGEIFQVKKEEVEKIDGLNVVSLNLKAEKILCPNCNIEMSKYRNPVYKLDFELDYCTKCNGFWFDKSEAIKFKKICDEKIKVLKNETKITLKPSVENFYDLAKKEEEADEFLKSLYSILSFFLPF